MKKTTTMKAFALSLAMALGMLLPTTTNAQNDGFFRGNMDNYENRDAGINSNDGAGISNWGIGEEVPLGSGLLVLAAAGAGYAALRRKRNKKGFVMIIALAMIVTMSNCKKKVETINSVAENGVKITLTVDGGSKVIVDPTGHTNPDYATVKFESGDVIYVGNNGHYCGYLQHNGTYFSGSISETNLSTSDYLHFYFMGNKGTTSQPASVSITDQTSKYPVISYAHSNELYNGAGSYTAKLENYCAIVKFTTTDIYPEITITGMNNTVSVNFEANNAADGTGIDHNPYTPSKTGEGDITLHKVSNTERWAILLPQGEVTTATASAPNYVSESAFTVPEITANMYNSDGVFVSLSKLPYIDANFTVANGRTVKFAAGNLQYNKTTGKFSLMEHQYSTVETTSQNIGTDYANQNIVSLFGWGTSGISGYTPIATCYQPWSTSTNGILYNPYGSTSTNLYDGGDNAGKADWGYNAISNGGNTGNMWRTLTNAEWGYVFNTRSTTSGHRYAKATVCGKSGVILLPDNWSDGTYSLNNYNTTGAAFIGNTIDADEWAALEAAGCVFLPAAGYRGGTSVLNVGSYGLYWSGTRYNSRYTYSVLFYSGNVNPSSYDYRYLGYSVRLVF